MAIKVLEGSLVDKIAENRVKITIMQNQIIDLINKTKTVSSSSEEEIPRPDPN